MRIDANNVNLHLFSSAQERPSVSVAFVAPAPAAEAGAACPADQDRAMRDAYLYAASHRMVARVVSGLDQTPDV